MEAAWEVSGSTLVRYTAVFQFCQDIQHFFAHGFAGNRLRFIGLRVWLFGVERYGQLRGKLISSFYGISDSIIISVHPGPVYDFPLLPASGAQALQPGTVPLAGLPFFPFWPFHGTMLLYTLIERSAILLCRGA